MFCVLNSNYHLSCLLFICLLRITAITCDTILIAHITLGMTNREVLQQVEQGYRMPKLPDCPDALYEIMIECWNHEPLNRPSFETLQWKLEEFYFQDDGIYRESENMVS